MKRRPAKRGFSSRLELVERRRVADRDELRRVTVEPGAEIADRVDLEALEVGVAPRLGRHLRDVEQVVDVAVEMEAGREHGVHRLPRLGERDGDVEEELARRRVGDDGSLVADDEIVELRLLEVRPHGPEHPPGDDHDVDAGGPRPRERVPGARPQHAVLARSASGRDRARRRRRAPEARRELYGAVPPVETTT